MRHRSLSVLSTLVTAGSVALVGAITIGTAAPVAAFVGTPPVISEVMFNPASAEDDWEWIELYNPGTEALDLAGWVVDDVNNTAVAAPNIASGSVPAGGSAVLFNVDDVSAANFAAAWGTGINLVPVTGWSAMALNNSGLETIGLWENATGHAGDQAVHANAVISVTYNTSIDDGAGSTFLTDLTDQTSFALSTDGTVTPVGTTYTSMALGGNLGTDVGSPGGSFDPVPPVFSEIMFNPGVEDGWEWVEVHNPDSVALDLAGWVFDDFNSVAHSAANIAAGSIPAGGSAILFNVDDVSAADFAAAWGTGINVVPVTNWAAGALNNGGDTIALWASFADYENDNVAQANAVVSVAYDGTIDDGFGSVYLPDLTDQNSFALSTDGVVTPIGTAYTSMDLGGNGGTDIGSPGGTFGDPLPPVFSEVMFDPASGEDNWEWVEVHNPGSVAIDLTGWVFDDFNGSAHSAANIAAGSIPAGGSAILFNADDVTAADFAAAWGTGINLVAVTNWAAGALNNGGDTIGLWASFGNYQGDNTALNNTVVSATYGGSIGNNAGSAYLTDLTDQTSFVLSTDGTVTPVGTTYTSKALGGNSGADVGSPGGTFDGGGGPATPRLISEIQGDGPTVTQPGESVEVSAIVTALFENNDALDGFFLQEEDAQADADPATSEGIFVFCRGVCPSSLATGDLVTVVGIADDFSGSSQITATELPTVQSSGNPIPTPATVRLPAPNGTDEKATFESVEGMLTTVTDTLVVSEYFELARFGSIVLTAGERPRQSTHVSTPSVAGLAAHDAALALRTIVLDDGNNNQNDAITPTDEPYPFPSPGLSTTNRFRGGDSITGLTGVMRYSFGQWTMTQSPELYDYTFQPTNPAPAAPEDVGGTLTVSSFNVLNFFTTVDTTTSRSSGPCAPSGTQDCRGADSEAEVTRQLDKLVTTLAGIDGDVVGLIELENTAAADPAGDGVDPVLERIVDALNVEVGAGTYDFIDTGAIGTDAIRVALIFKPASVTPAGAFDILDSSDDPRFVDTRNRPMLTQTFDEVATGARFTVSVNHLKSKGSGCGAGDDAADGSGNCNGTRTAAAEAIVDHLATDPTGSGDPDFLIIGDLNAYRRETPVTTLTGGGYVDLIEAFGGDDAYSYLFDGQLGYLDHALANPSLTGQVTGVTEWHINADEVPLFDYNDDISDIGEDSFEKKSGSLPLYSVDPLRTSDHDPVIVGLALEPPPAPEVLMVVGTVGSSGAVPDGDQPVLDIIEGFGTNVMIVDDDDLVPGIDAGKDLVVISSSVRPSKVGDAFTTSTAAVLTWEGFLFDELRFNTAGGGRNGETLTRQKVLDVVDPTQPLSAGYSGPQTVASSLTRFAYSRPEGDAQIVATVNGDATIFGFEAGAQMAGGSTAPARRVGLFMSYFTPLSLTSVGGDLVTAAVAWALGETGAPANAAPVVDAGADQSISSVEPIEVALDGTVDDDGRPIPPAAVTTEWTADDPGVVFADSFAVDTTATLPGPGVYELTLTADDSDLTGSDTVTITVVDGPDGLRIAYVAANASPPTGDAPIVDHLRAVGAEVTVVDDDNASSTSYSDYDVVFVSTSVTLVKIGALFKNSEIPLITTEQFLLDDNMMASAPLGQRGGRTLAIANAGSELAAGLSGVIRFTDRSSGVGFGTPAAGADVVATRQGKAVYFAYDAGQPMVSGFPAPARRVAFPGTFRTAASGTANYFALLDAAVVWAAA